MRALAIVLAALTCVSVFPAVSQASVPNPRQESSPNKQAETANKEQRLSNYERGTQEAPVFVQHVQSAAEVERAEEEAAFKKSESLWEHKSVIANSVIAFFTVVLAAFTILMWRHGKETTKRQLRAYVGVESGQITIGPTGRTFEAHVKITNAGQTPGGAFVSTAKVELSGSAVPFLFEVEHEAQPPKSIIHPRSSANLDRSRDFTPADLQAVENRTMCIRFWGRIDYTDAFGEAHYYIFRTSVTGPPKTLPDNTRYWPLTPDPSGYEAS